MYVFFIYLFQYTDCLKLIYLLAEVASGLRKTKITESPRKNIFEIKRSLLTGFTFFLPLPVRGTSVHISLTLKYLKKKRFNTMLMIYNAKLNEYEHEYVPFKNHVTMTIKCFYTTQ